MIYPKLQNRVDQLGQKFFVYEAVDRHEEVEPWGGSIVMETYSTITGQWDTVETIWSNPVGTLLLARQKFCQANALRMHVYNPRENVYNPREKKSCSLMHSFSLEAVSPDTNHLKSSMAVVEVVQDELMAIVHWVNRDRTLGSGLLQTVGLGGNNIEIEWHKAPFFTSTPNWDPKDLLKYFIRSGRLWKDP